MARKRTAISVAPKKKIAKVIALSIDDMAMSNNNGYKFHLKRLRYRGVPKLQQGARNLSLDPFVRNKGFVPKTILVNAGRDNVIREMYEHYKGDQKKFCNIRGGLVAYFRYLDAMECQSDVFDLTVMSDCIKHYNELALTGKDTTKASSIKYAISSILKKMEKNSVVRKLPAAIQHKHKGTYGGALDIETELKPVARILRKGFESFVRHFKVGTLPDTHPFYDEEQLNQRAQADGWSINKLSGTKGGYKSCFRDSLDANDAPANARMVINQAVSNATFLFYMLTGMNTKVLADVTYSDVTFRNIHNGRYVLGGIKGRANYKSVDNSIGFSKHTKGMIEDWLNVSKIVYANMGCEVSANTLLFPYFRTDGETLNRTDATVSRLSMNKRIEPLLGFKINASRFRKTKADVLIRATEDMYLVSQGLNNTINVTIKSYSNGVDSDHNRNLSASFDAQMSIAKGKSITEAVKNAKVLHSDILSEFDYKERLHRNEIPATTITPTGIRCAGADKNKMQEENKKAERFGASLPGRESKCTDFFGCYDCPSHRLVSGEMEIWLMLSFQYQVLEMKELIAISSSPLQELYENEAIISKTLTRMKAKAPDNYRRAVTMIDEKGLHPLYQNRHSLKYLLEGFND